MKRRVEDWMRIHKSILAGRCANEYLWNISMDSLIDYAVWGADDLIKRLRERESDDER